MQAVISCEHASAAAPTRYQAVFRNAGSVRNSHRGFDRGARTLARQIARGLRAPCFEAPATRLLADPNRSLGSRQLFSEWSDRLDHEAKQDIIARYWRPHRDAVESAVRQRTTDDRTVVHLSVHTFTPVWNGVEREADVAFLYDPGRASERSFVELWRARLRERRPDLRLRRNYPYRGTADGLTTHLRRIFPASRYLGIELEVSQLFPAGSVAQWSRLRQDTYLTLHEVLQALPSPS